MSLNNKISGMKENNNFATEIMLLKLNSALRNIIGIDTEENLVNQCGTKQRTSYNSYCILQLQCKAETNVKKQ